MFANDLLASAALDRLTHHVHTLIIRGQSYRQRSRRMENAGSLAVSPADNPSTILSQSAATLEKWTTPG